MFTNAALARPVHSFGNRQTLPTGGEELWRTESITSADLDMPLILGNYDPVSKLARVNDNFSSYEAKTDSISGTVYSIGDDFVIVRAVTPNGALDLTISRVLCPDDILYEGAAIEIKEDRSTKFSGLSIEPRVPAPISPEAAAIVDDVLEWANSL
ncbi:hypothetical protein HB771_17245 [Rhizobium leguminosarum bv. viciae]|nr:hypothetical protein HB771_17245 [Rhizobium leguminosarum bv. viciae]